ASPTPPRGPWAAHPARILAPQLPTRRALRRGGPARRGDLASLAPRTATDERDPAHERRQLVARPPSARLPRVRSGGADPRRDLIGGHSRDGRVPARRH